MKLCIVYNHPVFGCLLMVLTSSILFIGLKHCGDEGISCSVLEVELNLAPGIIIAFLSGEAGVDVEPDA